MKFAEDDTVIVLLEIELIAPLNTAGRVNGIEISESELAGNAKAVNPTGSVAAEVGVGLVSAGVTDPETAGFTVVSLTIVGFSVVGLNFEGVWADAFGAAANETEITPKRATEDKKKGDFIKLRGG